MNRVSGKVSGSNADGVAGASGAVAFTNKESLTRADLPPLPAGCKRPYLVPSATGPKYRRCGKPRCCAECRGFWAWKRALCLIVSFRACPPSHFATIRPVPGMAGSAFVAAVGKFLLALKRRVELAYLLAREWRSGVMHCHGLFRAAKLPRRAVREAKSIGRVRVSVRPVRNAVGAARYVVKDTRNPAKRPELAPPGRVRLLIVSRGFLSAPWRKLWQQVQAERAARKGGVA